MAFPSGDPWSSPPSSVASAHETTGPLLHHLPPVPSLTPHWTIGNEERDAQIAKLEKKLERLTTKRKTPVPPSKLSLAERKRLKDEEIRSALEKKSKAALRSAATTSTKRRSKRTPRTRPPSTGRQREGTTALLGGYDDLDERGEVVEEPRGGGGGGGGRNSSDSDSDSASGSESEGSLRYGNEDEAQAEAHAFEVVSLLSAVDNSAKLTSPSIVMLPVAERAVVRDELPPWWSWSGCGCGGGGGWYGWSCGGAAAGCCVSPTCCKADWCE